MGKEKELKNFFRYALSRLDGAWFRYFPPFSMVGCFKATFIIESS